VCCGSDSLLQQVELSECRLMRNLGVNEVTPEVIRPGA